MNQLARHFWFTLSALSVKFPLHSNEVYSAPVRAYAELQKTILPALETDPGLQQTAVDLFPNYPDFASVDGTQHDTSGIRNLEPRSLSKRSINWNKALKSKRKKKKVSKEDKKAKEVKEKQGKKEKPPEEMSKKQGEKEKPPGEGKKKRERKPTAAQRQEKQKKLRKIKKTKSKLQRKHPKGKTSPTRKKLK
ncbi:unnamed protein product [Caretta caretta]